VVGLGLPIINRRCSTPVPTLLQQPLSWSLTDHCAYRRGARQITPAAVLAALRYGRAAWTRGARVFAIGRKEVAHFRTQGVDLRPFAGVQVVTSPDGAILTVYRSDDLRALRRTCRRPWRARRGQTR
jgi:hypothetical protein